MAIHQYIKEHNTVQKKIVNYFSYLVLTAGSLLLFWAFYPVVSFEIYSQFFIPRDLVTPVPGSQIASFTLQDTTPGAYSIFSNNLRDFTQASVWFPTESKVISSSKLSIKDYYLSIPKLDIDKAHVIIGGEDLAKSLIHYLPTSAPGENGNVVIFGHSTLPQLYNPKDYKTIFTYLPSLEKGDKVLLKTKDVTYEYEIYEMFVVKPDQIWVLEPQYDSSYLTLITCVPPGTYWNRLVVRAKLTRLPTTL